MNFYVISIGSSTYGEFFNPGIDCTDILNQNPNAQDGFYWINLNEDSIKQVKNFSVYTMHV
jgi:hypothetical protein